MSCRRYEKWIARWVEGDLAERRAGRLEAHLAVCGACRELAESLAGSQAALKSLRAEAVDVHALEQVRRAVLEQIAAEQGMRRSWLGLAWRYVVAGLLVAIAGGALWWRSQRSAPVQPVVARVPQVTALPPRMPAPRPPTVAAARPRKHRRPVPRPKVERPSRPPAGSEPLLVKLETADPNVVIYLLVDQNGG